MLGEKCHLDIWVLQQSLTSFEAIIACVGFLLIAAGAIIGLFLVLCDSKTSIG